METSGVFGSTTRDRVLKFVALVKSTYPSEIASALDLPLTNVQAATNALQRAGVLASRLVGRTRVVELNRAWYASTELAALIEKMARADPSTFEAAAKRRRRPRRARKPI